MEGSREYEQATDMELVFGLIQHIEKPCEDLEGNNIRDFYIREAERILNTIQNPDARSMLEEIINKYKT